jgi:hypothetical protein
MDRSIAPLGICNDLLKGGIFVLVGGCGKPIDCPRDNCRLGMHTIPLDCLCECNDYGFVASDLFIGRSGETEVGQIFFNRRG